MGDLAARLAGEQVDDLLEACGGLLTANHASDEQIDDFNTTAERLRRVSLLGMGKLRARAKLEETSYVARQSLDDELFAEPISALGGF